jgi:predicted RecA/RadA family phage recombinase
MNVICNRIGLLVLCLCLRLPAVGAEDQPAPESATFKDNKVLIPKDGKLAAATKDVSFPGEIVIKTNGIFTVNKGKSRQLREGQTIDAQGMLTSPDGSVVPVFDHLVLKGGRVQISQDGESKPLTREFALPDGARVSPDGSLRGRDGRLQRMLDGQLMRLDGSTVAVTDTVSLKGGKVVLFKDGGHVELRRGQVMAMSDRTRVNGDGTVIRPDGTKVILKEGDTLKIPGVAAPRR